MKKPVLDLTRISKYMSLILRHKPEAIGIELDAHGWANVDALLAGIGRKYAIDRGVLEEIVRTDGKQRYSFNADRTMIRANQGHSIPVDVELSINNNGSRKTLKICQKFNLVMIEAIIARIIKKTIIAK